MLSKKDVSETLSLSCVESYFLAWLKNYYDISNLYFHSYISLKQAFHDFLNGAVYESYYFLPRLQDVAEKYSVVTHEFYTISSEAALEKIMQLSEADLCLMRVNNKFFNTYKRAAWRKDHFVCVDKKMNWINEYPLSDGIFTVERFFEVYGGELCIYKIKDLCAKVPMDLELEQSLQDFEINEFPSDLAQLESAIGVLRVSRKRLEEYFRDNQKLVNLLKEEIEFLDKLYFAVHLQRIKKIEYRDDQKIRIYSNFYNKIFYIINIEKKILKELSCG